MVLALTHMRLPNDLKLAAAVPGIDAVLGGHDHEYSLIESQVGAGTGCEGGGAVRRRGLGRCRVARLAMLPRAPEAMETPCNLPHSQPLLPGRSRTVRPW